MFDAGPDALAAALAEAEDAVSRADERLAACPFRAGLIGRIDFAEAVAWGWSSGRVVATEDLLLHDESMDRRMPDENLRATHTLLRARRKASSGGAELLSREGVDWLLARSQRPPSAALRDRAPAARRLDPEAPVFPQLIAELERLASGTTERDADALAEWTPLLRLEHPRLPLLLQAAVALTGWRIIAAYPRQSYLGPLLVALWLRHRRRTRSHLLALEAGFRELERRAPLWRAVSLQDQLLFWLQALTAAAASTTETLNRLQLAREVALRRIGARRAHCRLHDLVDLLLERPLVTAPLAAERLKVADHTARRLFGELGGSVTEVTGQNRYRAWRL